MGAISAKEEYVVYADYVHAKLQEKTGSFLSDFLNACLHADHSNFPLLIPALKVVMDKYPLRPELRGTAEAEEENVPLERTLDDWKKVAEAMVDELPAESTDFQVVQALSPVVSTIKNVDWVRVVLGHAKQYHHQRPRMITEQR